LQSVSGSIVVSTVLNRRIELDFRENRIARHKPTVIKKKEERRKKKQKEESRKQKEKVKKRA